MSLTPRYKRFADVSSTLLSQVVRTDLAQLYHMDIKVQYWITKGPHVSEEGTRLCETDPHLWQTSSPSVTIDVDFLPYPCLGTLQGAPYAYTPFCDNNKEMDEYRFWKGGFWRDHLQVRDLQFILSLRGRW